MKLVHQEFELLNQLNEKYSIDKMYEFIEMCARTCYKSSPSGDSKAFVNKLANNGHLAMLEHGTIYLRKSLSDASSSFYVHNPYSKVNIVEQGNSRGYYITTNLRVLVENKIPYKSFHIVPPTEYHIKRYTVKFITSRQIANEFVRHRVFSFAQESSRYCNYSNKKKFENNLVFIHPVFMEDKTTLECSKYFEYLTNCEKLYLDLKDKGWKTEEVASLLPNITKTELIMTGFADDWKHFFDLRALGTTGKPHPMAMELAYPLYYKFKELKYI